MCRGLQKQAVSQHFILGVQRRIELSREEWSHCLAEFSNNSRGFEVQDLGRGAKGGGGFQGFYYMKDCSTVKPLYKKPLYKKLRP